MALSASGYSSYRHFLLSSPDAWDSYPHPDLKNPRKKGWRPIDAQTALLLLQILSSPEWGEPGFLFMKSSIMPLPLVAKNPAAWL